MDEMYGLGSRGDEYAEKALMSPENLMIPEEYNQYDHYHSLIHSAAPPMFGSDELGFQCSAVSHDSASVNVHHHNQTHVREHDDDDDSSLIKAKISSHPSYSKLLDAYIDCQKVGAPPEIACVLDEIRREKDLCKQDAVSMCFGVDPELDDFMETYCDILGKYKADLSRPFDEATSFLSEIETQLVNLCNDEVAAAMSSEESEEIEIEDAQIMKREDRQLKEKLLRMYGSHISSLRLEFSKKKKKGKLPKDARQTLLSWWDLHSKWPYPTEADKIGLAETTGLDQKQINNWFINQRKRHWKSPENMQLDVVADIVSPNFAPLH